MTTVDFVLFALFLVIVAAVSLIASRGERTRADYFLASRRLTWWLIGFSLIASNISTEHFVGMTGNAAKSGFAVASYEWLAAPALVAVAWWLLPRFLRAGIYTMPEYLEYRYDRGARSIMAALMVVFFVITVLATVVYAGATFLSGVLDLPAFFVERGMSQEGAKSAAFHVGVWGIGIAAGIYTVIGGLKAVVWSDLLQGGALLLGGTVVTFLALKQLGDGEGIMAGWANFVDANREQLHIVRAWDDPEIPSLSLVTGLWIPVMFYWGLNQFITQRTLGAGSLAEGQKGIFFAALIKLYLPFIVVIPGMMAVQILGADLDTDQYDNAYPILLRHLLPAGLMGLMLAAVAGSVMSTFNSGLNSAATIFTMDLWANYIERDMDERRAVRVGRWTTAILAIAACAWAPVINSFEGVFNYIQELWGFVSAPTCAVFFIGMVTRRVPAGAAKAAFIVGPLVYLLSRAPSWIWTAEEAETAGGLIETLHGYASLAFLYHMFIIFLLLIVGMTIWGRLAPLAEPRVMPERAVIDVQPMRSQWLVGGLVLAVTLVLYIIFW